MGPCVVIIETWYYAPAQAALDHDNLYIGMSAKIPIGRPQLLLGVGRERGALAPGGKIDWNLGASMTLKGFEASLSYVDCDRRVADWQGRRISGATVVFQITHTF
jgi:hypothetical protein